MKRFSKIYRKMAYPVIGIVCLATVGFGLAGIAGAAENAATYAPSLSPSSVTPENGVEVPSTEGLTSVKFLFPGGGEIGVEKLNKEGRTIDVKNAAGVIVQSLDCTTNGVLSYDINQANAVIVNFPNPVKTPGEYSFVLPEGLVVMAEDSGSLGSSESTEETQEELLAKRTNKAFTYNFKVVDAPEFSMSPLPGKYEPSELVTITFTYPEGTEISVNSESTTLPSLWNYCNNVTSDGDSFVRTKVTDYAVSASGNVVTLTARSASSIKSMTKGSGQEWDYVIVPANAWTARLNGNSYPIYNLKYEKYELRDKSVVDLECEYEPGKTDNFAGTDFKEVDIIYPATYVPKLEVGKTAGSLRQFAPGATANTSDAFNFGTYIVKAVDTERRRMTLRLSDPTGIRYINNVDRMQTGWYALRLNNGAFQTGETTTTVNPLTDFDPVYVTGKESTSIADFQLMVGGKYVSETFAEESTGFTKVMFKYPISVDLIDSNAKIQLLKGGTVFKETAASDRLKSNSYDAETSTNGTEWHYAFSGSTAITDPGTYTIHIPAGIYRQNRLGKTYVNEEENIQVSIGASIPYTINPTGTQSVPYVFSDGIGDIKVTYNEAKVDLSKADLTKVRMTLDSKYSYSPVSIEKDGDHSLVMHFPKDVVCNAQQNYKYFLNIASGAWHVESAGVTSPNKAYTTSGSSGSFYVVSNITPGVPAPAAGSTVEIADLKNIEYLSSVEPLAAAAAFGSNSKPYLRVKGTTDHILDYGKPTRTADDDHNFTLTASADPTISLAAGTIVELVIPTQSLFKYAYSTSSEIVHEYTIKGSETSSYLPATDILGLMYPSSPEANASNSKKPDGSVGFGMVFYSVSDGAARPADSGWKGNCRLSYRTNADSEWVLVEEFGAPGEGESNRIQYMSASAGDEGDSEVSSGSSIFMVFDADQTNDAKFSAPGLYKVEIPAGALKKGDELYGAATFEYSYTDQVVAKEYPYTVTPAPGTVFTPETASALNEIKVTFTGCKSLLQYKGNTLADIATLTGPDGNIAIDKYATGGKNYLVFKPAAEVTDWADGEYTLTVKPGSISIDDTMWDQESDTDFPGITVRYTVKKDELPEISFDPDPSEIIPINSAETAFSKFVVTFNTAETLDFASVSHIYLCKISDENGTLVMNAPTAATVSGNKVTFNLALKSGCSLSEGEYTFTIFKDKLKINGTNNKEITQVYKVGSVSPGKTDYSYEVTPAADTEFTPETASALNEIKVTFKNCNSLQHKGSSVADIATFIGPDGEISLDAGVTAGSNYLTFKPAAEVTDWAEGEYTLTINPGTISIDDTEWDKVSDTDFPGITVKYTVKVKPKDYTFNPDPSISITADKAPTALARIVMTCNNANTVALAGIAMNICNIMDADGNVIMNSTSRSATVSGKTVTLNLQLSSGKSFSAGVYTLTIFSGKLKINGTTITEVITQDFIVSPIEKEAKLIYVVKKEMEHQHYDNGFTADNYDWSEGADHTARYEINTNFCSNQEAVDENVIKVSVVPQFTTLTYDNLNSEDKALYDDESTRHHVDFKVYEPAWGKLTSANNLEFHAKQCGRYTVTLSVDSEGWKKESKSFDVTLTPTFDMLSVPYCINDGDGNWHIEVEDGAPDNDCLNGIYVHTHHADDLLYFNVERKEVANASAIAYAAATGDNYEGKDWSLMTARGVDLRNAAKLHLKLVTNDQTVYNTMNFTNVVTGVDGIAVEGMPALYFNLEGMQLPAEPACGTFIVIKDGRMSKVMK